MFRTALLLLLGASSAYSENIAISINQGVYAGTAPPVTPAAALPSVTGTHIPATTSCTESAGGSISTITVPACGIAGSLPCTDGASGLPFLSGKVVVNQVTVSVFPTAPAGCSTCTPGAIKTVTRTLLPVAPTKLAHVYAAPGNCTSQGVAGSTGVPGCPGCSGGSGFATYIPSSGADVRTLTDGFLALMGLIVGAAAFL